MNEADATKDRAGGSSRASARKFWIAVGSAILAFVLFLITPIGEPFRQTAYGVLSPIVRRVLNNGLTFLGSTPVSLENQAEYTGQEFSVDVAVQDGEKTPSDGCFGSESWLKDHGGIPTNSEMYTEVITGRTDVTLVAADLKYTIRDSAAKAVVTCNAGGDGATTFFSFKVDENGHLETRTSGPGATEKGDSVRLRLEPGSTYPVAATMSVEGYQVVSWQATLRFRVADKQFRIPLGESETAGVSGLPRFGAESNGVWRRLP